MKPKIVMQRMAVARQVGMSNGYGDTPLKAFADLRRREALRVKNARDKKANMASTLAQYREWHSNEVKKAVDGAVGAMRLALNEQERRQEEFIRDRSTLVMAMWVQTAMDRFRSKTPEEAFKELAKRGVNLDGSQHDAKVFYERHMHQFKKFVPDVPANHIGKHNETRR